MTDKAALLAAFSDFRLVKGRKVAQLVFEVAIENADAALKALGGVPMPMSEVWCGIARIDPDVGLPTADDVKGILRPATASAKPAKEDMPGSSKLDGRLRRKWDELSYAEQAGIRCSEPAFIDFCYKHVSYSLNVAEAVRHWCQVKTRADIKRGTAQGDSWEQLESKYQTWLKVAEIVG